MKAKPVEQAKARRLRADGVPMKQIATRLRVSPASVYAWTRDVPISEEQLAANRRAAAVARNVAWAERHREIRRRYQAEGRERARQGDSLHQAGCMLYWAEGAKARNSVLLANSDPHMLSFFRRFLTECFEVSPADFTMSVNVYLNNGIAIDEIERYWLGVLELPKSCVRTHILNHMPTSSSGQRLNKLPYGVCRVRVHSTRIVQHIFGAIQEYADFEEPRWLDGAPRRAKAEVLSAA
jgi:hypothetical protein